MAKLTFCAAVPCMEFASRLEGTELSAAAAAAAVPEAVGSSAALFKAVDSLVMSSIEIEITKRPKNIFMKKQQIQAFTYRTRNPHEQRVREEDNLPINQCRGISAVQLRFCHLQGP